MSHHLVEPFDSMNYHWFGQFIFSNWVEQDVSCSRWCHQSLLFDVHLDEWVLSWPQLHLSFYTWHPESLLIGFWVNLHQRSRFWHGCETCLPFYQICLNPNLQVDKVGWTNQTISCFLLSSLTWIQSWRATLYSGWCCIWRYHCQRLKLFVDWCAVCIKLGQSQVLHRDNFVHFKVTCKGPHKFGITKKLCDNAFR